MNVQFDIVATEHDIVLSLRRPAYRDSEVVLLKGDVWHFNEDESSSFSVKQCTPHESNIEFAMRGHRATLHGAHELKRV